jgi:probable HAF family extracellular repeat protein
VGISASAASPEEGFAWTAASGMQPLGFLPGDNFSSAFAVSADGAVIVGRSGVIGSEEGGTEAVRWVGGGLEGLGDLPGGRFNSFATAVSSDGAVVVGASESAEGGSTRTEAFRWTETGGMQGLGLLVSGPSATTAQGVSTDGNRVVGVSQSSLSGEDAFFWSPEHGMRALQDVLEQDFGLDFGGWVLSSATQISADGSTIVGRGLNPLGSVEAWVAVIPVPEPSRGLGFVTALASLGGLFRLRTRQLKRSRPRVCSQN